jgi:hypothetical protein
LGVGSGQQETNYRPKKNVGGTMRVEFPSIVNSEKYRFIYNSEQWQVAPVNAHFEVREKRQHTDSWIFPIALPVNLVGEYLISLASVMLENDELCRSVAYDLTCGPDKDRIEFSSKVIYKAGKKTRYFSSKVQKISAVSSKQYDKRYEEIKEGMDGSPQSIFNLLISNFSRDGLTRYIYARDIHEWLYSDRKKYRKFRMDDPAQFVSWTDNYDEMYAIRCAFESCLTALAIYRAKIDFKNKLDGYNQHMMLIKLEQ